MERKQPKQVRYPSTEEYSMSHESEMSNINRKKVKSAISEAANIVRKSNISSWKNRK